MKGLSERDVERLAEALREHRQMHDPSTGGSSCECGGWIGPFTLLPVGDNRSHAAHVADALAPVVAAIRNEAKAEAWNEGVHAGRTHQQEVQRHAHWSHIGKALPDPIVNPYRALLDGGDQS